MLLIVPCVEKGRGGGHLARSVRLAQDLRQRTGKEAFVYMENANWELGAGIGEGVFINNLYGGPWEAIILDRFRTPAKELAQWRKLAPVVGIDEGGSRRKYFDFLIDLLPNLEQHKANITKPGFLFKELPPPEAHAVPLSTLVSFGAEDTAGLTVPVSLELLAKGFAVTALFGSLNPTPEAKRELLRTNGATVLEKLNKLEDKLPQFELVVTHFGLTAFETLRANRAVLLVSPSAYHEKLALNAGFVTAQLKKLPSPEVLPELKARTTILAQKYAVNYPASLADLCGKAEFHVVKCPICGCAAVVPSLARFEDRTYRICSRCSTVYMTRFTAKPIEYKHEYFFESYKKQYGRTYLDDFPNLLSLAEKRIVLMQRLCFPHGTRDTKPRLLDIGCAYGAFLSIAKRHGFLVEGLEPYADAANYTRAKLEIPCKQNFFPQHELYAAERFDAVTMWFVLEHFEETAFVLKECNKILKKKGVLAFSTPSFSGASARKSQEDFLRASPPDHYVIFDPKTIRTVLKKFGFSVKKIVSTGIHPERFSVLGKFASRHPGFSEFLVGLGKIFYWGDTFEVYAVKTRDLRDSTVE